MYLLSLNSLYYYYSRSVLGPSDRGPLHPLKNTLNLVLSVYVFFFLFANSLASICPLRDILSIFELNWINMILNFRHVLEVCHRKWLTTVCSSKRWLTHWILYAWHLQLRQHHCSQIPNMCLWASRIWSTSNLQSVEGTEHKNSTKRRIFGFVDWKLWIILVSVRM